MHGVETIFLKIFFVLCYDWKLKINYYADYDQESFRVKLWFLQWNFQADQKAISLKLNRFKQWKVIFEMQIKTTYRSILKYVNVNIVCSNVIGTWNKVRDNKYSVQNQKYKQIKRKIMTDNLSTVLYLFYTMPDDYRWESQRKSIPWWEPLTFNLSMIT